MQPYKTHDLPFAAYLVTVGQEMLDPERGEGQRVWFVFSVEDRDQFEQRRRAWTNDTALVAPQRFSNAIKSLKTMVFEVLREQPPAPAWLEAEVMRRRG